MIWTEMKYDLPKVKDALEQLFKENYGSKVVDKKLQFKSKHGEWFRLCIVGDKAPYDFLVIEYLDTGEDGDAFYPKDCYDLGVLYEDMVREIEG